MIFWCQLTLGRPFENDTKLLEQKLQKICKLGGKILFYRNPEIDRSKTVYFCQSFCFIRTLWKHFGLIQDQHFRNKKISKMNQKHKHSYEVRKQFANSLYSSIPSSGLVDNSVVFSITSFWLSLWYFSFY